MKILIATNNKHKIIEIQKIANKLLSKPIQFVSPAELNIECQPEENGKTLTENSTIKAIAFYNALRELNIEPMPVVADDSGLEITALNGLPGVHSARFAEPLANKSKQEIDKANRDKVLQLLKNQPNRQAKFCTVLTLYDGTNAKHYIGECPGEIIAEERGTNGFGYDPIFVPAGFTRTFAEMNDAEKNAISHRQFAVVKFLEDKFM